MNCIKRILKKEANCDEWRMRLARLQGLVMVGTTSGNLQEVIRILGLDWGRLELKIRVWQLWIFCKMFRGSPGCVLVWSWPMACLYREWWGDTKKQVCNSHNRLLEFHEYPFVTLAKVMGFCPFLNFEWVKTYWPCCTRKWGPLHALKQPLTILFVIILIYLIFN